MDLSTARTKIHGLDLELMVDVPVVYQCHHFNLFWDQTIDDALGLDLGAIVRTRAAREAYYDLLNGLAARAGGTTPEHRKTLASLIFSSMGLGRLTLAAGASGGDVLGDSLHFGTAWHEKYGSKLRRRRPADAIAAGFAAAAIEVAYDLPRETMSAREVRCVALRDPRCEMTLKPAEQSAIPPSVGRAQIEGRRPPFDGLNESSILM